MRKNGADKIDLEAANVVSAGERDRDNSSKSKRKRQQQQENLLASHHEQQPLHQGKSKTHHQQQQQLTRERSELHQPPSSNASDEMDFKNNNKNKNLKKTCLFILLPMTVALILAAILVVILILPTILDQDDKCFNSFQPTNYKLYATKTTYTSAIDYLNQSTRQSHQLPSFLTASSASTLREINNHLTNSRNCKVRQLHYFGRHAARYPSANEIAQINKLIESVQSRIEPARYSSLNVNNNNNSPDSPAKVCLSPLAEFKSWITPLAKENGNLVTDFGIEETRAIADRFKAIYPNMFDASQTKVEFGVTKETRTAQTAFIFQDAVEGLNVSPSSKDKPTVSSLVDNVHNKELLDDFTRKNRAMKLEFHDRCKSMHKDEIQLPYNFNLDHENRTKFITISISKKLKLNNEEFLTKEETEAIYDMCKYETALLGASRSGPSIWCNLFTESQLKFLEYVNDVRKFYKVYAHPDQARSACPVTTDLMRSFKSLLLQQDRPEAPSAAFYFTHSQVIQKILANLIELESDSGYLTKNVLAHLDAGSVPDRRDWQTSLLSPFAANVAFTAYECPTSNSGSPDIRIVTSINERPVLIDGCDEFICPLERIIDDGKINKEKRCKLEEICRKNIVTT